MGVPFEALLPYGMVVGVGLLERSLFEVSLTLSDVLYLWGGAFNTQALGQWGQEGEKRYR